MAEGNGTRKGVANCGKINNKVLGPPSLGARRRRQHASRPKGRPSPAVGVAANRRRRRPQPRRLIRGRRALHSSRSPSWAFLRGRGGPSLRIRRPVISSAMAAAPRPSSCPRRCARRPEHSGGHPSGALCPDSTRDSAPPQFGRRLLSSGDDCGGPLVPGWQALHPRSCLFCSLFHLAESQLPRFLLGLRREKRFRPVSRSLRFVRLRYGLATPIPTWPSTARPPPPACPPPPPPSALLRRPPRPSDRRWRAVAPRMPRTRRGPSACSVEASPPPVRRRVQRTPPACSTGPGRQLIRQRGQENS